MESRQGRASGPNGPFQESKAFLHFHTVGDMTSPRLCKNGPKLEIHSSWNVNSLRHSSNWENLGNITSKHLKASFVHCSCCMLLPSQSTDCVQCFVRALYCLQYLQCFCSSRSSSSHLILIRCQSNTSCPSSNALLADAVCVLQPRTMFCLVQQQSWKKKAATAATAHCTDRFKSKLLNQLNQSLNFKLWPSTFLCLLIFISFYIRVFICLYSLYQTFRSPGALCNFDLPHARHPALHPEEIIVALAVQDKVQQSTNWRKTSKMQNDMI